MHWTPTMKRNVEHLNEFYKGKTVVVVAHRLSTVRDADKIVVLDGGKIVEEGTPGAYCNKREVLSAGEESA